MQILLDTNFILTCVKQKIDFPEIADQIISERIEWLVPQDVLNELGNLKDKAGTKIVDKRAAILSFEILKGLKPRVVELSGRNPNVDIKIVNYVLGTDIILATLDKDLKSRVDNRILSVRGKKGLELI